MLTRLDQLVSQPAIRSPDKIAIIDETRAITYGQLEAEVQALSNYLLDKGLTKKERVGILSRNSVTFAALYFAISRAGGVAVPLNYTLNALDIAKQANDCAISAIYTGKGLEEKGKDVASHVNSLRFIVDNSNTVAKNKGSPEVLENDICSIIYTSGTTGEPIGVMLSHKNIISNNTSIVKYAKLTASDSVICVLPFCYIFGLSLLFSYILAEGTVIIDNRFMYPNTILDTIDKYKATTFAGVSSHYAILIHRSDFAKRRLGSLKRFMQAGDSMPAKITRELIKMFPDKKLYIMYGQTEASPRLTYLTPGLVKDKPDSIGKAIPGVEIKIVNENNVECKAGEIGEIVARGDNTMAGYWNRPDETANTIKNGWLYTGDMAYKDKDGDIFIVGRKKNFIKIGANKVNPAEIERIAMENDSVMEVAAVGCPDEILGNRIMLFISPLPGREINSEEILDICKSRLPSYKVPQEIVIIDGTLPKNSYGKIDKEDLKELK